jgi:hypothetical protein
MPVVASNRVPTKEEVWQEQELRANHEGWFRASY